jgi:hypothetical protein
MTHSTKVTSKTFFIGTPGSWGAVSRSLKLLSCGRAKTVRFAGTVDELDDASETIGVVVLSVGGMADYALEICPNGMLDLPNDTIGMHLACSIKANVLVPDDIEGPPWWVLLRPDGTIEQVLLDAEKLDYSQVEYRIAEPRSG